MNNIYRNGEGYTDKVAGEAIKNAEIPHYVCQIYKALNHVASIHGFEVIGLRDKWTGKEYKL